MERGGVEGKRVLRAEYVGCTVKTQGLAKGKMWEKKKETIVSRSQASLSVFSFLFCFLVNPKGTLRRGPPREELGSSEVGEVSE